MLKITNLLLLTLSLTLQAQETMSLKNAVAVALEQNYGIRISYLDQESAERQVYRSNVGFGPEIDWNANFNSSFNYTNQRYLDGRTVDRFGRSFTPGTNVSLSLTLFDGGRMQASYDRLGLLSEYSAIQSRLIIQNTVVDVMRAYFEIVRSKKSVAYLQTIIRYYTERLKITEERWNVGRGSKLDYLQSKTDLSTQLSELARAQNRLRIAKLALNTLLVRNPELEYDVLDYDDPGDYDLDELTKAARDRNADILLLNKSIEISKKTEEEIEASAKPVVNLGSSIGYNYNNSNAGFILSNQTTAVNAGITARWNIFDGNHRKNQLSIAQLNTEISELNKESLEYQITADLITAYKQYLADKELLKMEEETILTAEENLSISLEKFRLGGSTILELNEAQRSYDAALNRLVEAQADVKLSELELLRLSGTLVE